MQITRSSYQVPTSQIRVAPPSLNAADNQSHVDHVTTDGVSYVDNNPLKPQRPTPLKDKVATAAFLGSAAWTAANIGVAVANAGSVAGAVGLAGAAAGAAALAWVAADAASGVFHWAVDNYPTVKTPGVGSIAGQFQIHHHRTQDLHDVSFWSNTAHAGQFLWAPLAAVAAVNPHPVIQAASMAFLGAGWLAQGSHRWTHADKNHPNPKIADVLQKLKVVQDPVDHRIHHRMPWSTNYCIVNGANNGWMSKLDVFPRLEKLVFNVTGKKPHSWHDPGVEAYSRASWGSRAERDAARAELEANAAENRKIFRSKVKPEYEELKVHFGIDQSAAR